MRSNAGMANRKGDVDLREAQDNVPPVNTLAWLAWKNPFLRRIYFAGNNKTHLGRHVQCPIFSSNFNPNF